MKRLILLMLLSIPGFSAFAQTGKIYLDPASVCQALRMVAPKHEIPQVRTFFEEISKALMDAGVRTEKIQEIKKVIIEATEQEVLMCIHSDQLEGSRIDFLARRAGDSFLAAELAEIKDPRISTDQAKKEEAMAALWAHYKSSFSRGLNAVLKPSEDYTEKTIGLLLNPANKLIEGLDDEPPRDFLKAWLDQASKLAGRYKKLHESTTIKSKKQNTIVKRLIPSIFSDQALGPGIEFIEKNVKGTTQDRDAWNFDEVYGYYHARKKAGYGRFVSERNKEGKIRVSHDFRFMIAGVLTAEVQETLYGKELPHHLERSQIRREAAGPFFASQEQASYQKKPWAEVKDTPVGKKYATQVADPGREVFLASASSSWDMNGENDSSEEHQVFPVDQFMDFHLLSSAYSINEWIYVEQPDVGVERDHHYYGSEGWASSPEKVVAIRSVRHKGKTHKVYVVSGSSEGTSYLSAITAEGHSIAVYFPQEEIFGIRQSLEDAKKKEGILAEIPGWLPYVVFPAHVERDFNGLELEISGNQTLVKSAPGQEVVRDDDRTVLRIGRFSKYEEVLGEENLGKYLEITQKLQADASFDEEVRSLVKDLKTEKEKIEVLRAGAKKMMTWVPVMWNEIPLSEILEFGLGDCSEYANLFTAMARRAGIPARSVSGLTIGSDGRFGFHAWNEVAPKRKDGTRVWIPLDVGFGDYPTKADRIRLFEGEWVAGEFPTEYSEVRFDYLRSSSEEAFKKLAIEAIRSVFADVKKILGIEEKTEASKKAPVNKK